MSKFIWGLVIIGLLIALLRLWLRSKARPEIESPPPDSAGIDTSRPAVGRSCSYHPYGSFDPPSPPPTEESPTFLPPSDFEPPPPPPLLSVPPLPQMVDIRPERVWLGASAPQKVSPNSEFTARFVAYNEVLEREIEDQLKKLSPRSTRHLRIKYCLWQPGTKVKVRLYGDYLVINQPEETFTWEGDSNIVDFDVRVSSDAPETTAVLKFDVLIGEFVVAKLRLDLEIGLAASAGAVNVAKIEPIKTAFASYASKDRERVLDRVSEIEKNGVDVFLDCLSLHPGDNWKDRLDREIRNRDSFFLF